MKRAHSRAGSLRSDLSRPPRSRAPYVALLVLTIAAGSASRRFPEWQPLFLALYAGDTLWAAMVFWLLCLFAPRRPTVPLAAAAVAVAYVVELSQLFHAPWIDAARGSSVGALVLGQGFLWSDLVCYSIGVGLAALLDVVLRAGPSASTVTTE